MPVSRKNPPSNAAAEIKTLAASGFSKIGIAAHFSVSVDTLDRWLSEDERLKAAMEIGRDSERHALHNALYRAAMEGDKIAAMFLLKARHSYIEGQQTENINRVAITFNLPGALPANEYKQLERVIDASAGNRTKQLPD